MTLRITRSILTRSLGLVELGLQFGDSLPQGGVLVALVLQRMLHLPELNPSSRSRVVQLLTTKQLENIRPLYHFVGKKKPMFVISLAVKEKTDKSNLLSSEIYQQNVNETVSGLLPWCV